jgi:hypothetical protein
MQCICYGRAFVTFLRSRCAVPNAHGFRLARSPCGPPVHRSTLSVCLLPRPQVHEQGNVLKPPSCLHLRTRMSASHGINMGHPTLAGLLGRGCGGSTAPGACWIIGSGVRRLDPTRRLLDYFLQFVPRARGVYVGPRHSLCRLRERSIARERAMGGAPGPSRMGVDQPKRFKSRRLTANTKQRQPPSPAPSRTGPQAVAAIVAASGRSLGPLQPRSQAPVMPPPA